MLCKKYCAGGTSYQSNLVPISITDRTILHAFSHIFAIVSLEEKIITFLAHCFHGVLSGYQ